MEQKDTIEIDVNGSNNEELKKLLAKRFEDMLWQILTFMEVSFPHKRGDGSENEQRYNIIRSKILRIGNDNIRELDTIMSCYVAFKAFDYKKTKSPDIDTQIFNFKNKFKILGEETKNDKGNNERV